MARRIKVYISIGYPTATHTDYFDLPDGWDEMSAEEQEKELDEYATAHRDNYLELSAEVVDEEED